MKRLAALALCTLFAVACSSSKVTIIQPELEFYQLQGPADLNYPVGRMEVQYAVRIGNRSSEPITLRSVQLRSVGSGGPYALVPRTYYFDRVIEPDQFADVEFWAHANAEGDPNAIDANAPVTVRGVAIFKTPSGSVRKVFQKALGQHGTGPRRGN